jgi:phosphatidylinositol-3-phosphatase
VVPPRPRGLTALFTAALALTACSGNPSPSHSPAPTGSDSAVPALDHVAVVVLENTSASTALADPGFARLARQGTLLTNVSAVAHNSLPNYLALTSGVTPTPSTMADCPNFDCQVRARTLPRQLDEAGVSWAAYVGDTSAPCRTPEPGQKDPYTHGYVLHHNPFAYYPSVGAGPHGGSSYCHSHLLPLSRLGPDAKSHKLPRYAFIIPGSCDDGHDRPCADGRRGGVSTAAAWLQHQWDTLRASASWTARSLLLVTFDEGAGDDFTSCCGDPGGGNVATVLLSGVVTAGGRNAHAYDHYSLLRTCEDALRLRGHLGRAAQVGPVTGVWITG